MYSQTQLANIGAAAGILVMVLGKFGVDVSTEEVTFLLGAVLTLASSAYSFYNRYKKGDLTLLGARK